MSLRTHVLYTFFFFFTNLVSFLEIDSPYGSLFRHGIKNKKLIVTSSFIFHNSEFFFSELRDIKGRNFLIHHSYLFIFHFVAETKPNCKT